MGDRIAQPCHTQARMLHGPSYHVFLPLQPMKAQFSSPDPAPVEPKSFGSPGFHLRKDERQLPYHVSQCSSEASVVID